MSVLSVEDAKEYLRATTMSDADAETLATIIEGAEALIVQRVGFLAPTAVTSRVDVYANGDVSLPHWPILSVDSIAYDGTTIDAAQYVVDLDVGMVEVSASTYSGRRVTVSYTAGRGVVPDDLMLAIKELVRHLWASQRGPTVRPGSAPSTELANTLPGSAYTLPVRVEQLLAAHRHIKVA